MHHVAGLPSGGADCGIALQVACKSGLCFVQPSIVDVVRNSENVASDLGLHFIHDEAELHREWHKIKTEGA